MGAPCSQRCYNTYGTFLCRCDQGYELGPDGFACNGRRPTLWWRIHVSDITNVPVSVPFCSVFCSHSTFTREQSIKPELVPWQTLMSAATPVTCASTSVSTSQGSSPVCAQRDTSCKAPDYARVGTPASISSRNQTPTSLFFQSHKCRTESILNHSLTAALFLSCSCSIQHHGCFSPTDINECETGEHQCTDTQSCVNIHGRYQCVDTNRCQSPYVQVSEKWVTPCESLCVLVHKHTHFHTPFPNY